MPANLTPEYLDAEERFKKASKHEEKLAALEEMLRLIPKHKGTEKMQADLKRRLSRFRKQAAEKKSSASAQRPFHYVEREGAGRAVLAGPPNSGKSDLLSRLTSARPDVADYPFVTRAPQPGMMKFEDVQIQLVDTPPLAPEILEPWQMAMLEQSDVVVLLFDVQDPLLLDQTDYLLSLLDERGLSARIDSTPPVLVLGNKTDLPGGTENFRAWRELFAGRIDPAPFSARNSDRLDWFRKMVFELLDVVRVYTKAPGKKVEEDQKPFVLRRGSTVLEAAAAVHKELAENFAFARIWAAGKYDGQMVERDYVLEDGDLLEIHD